MKEIEKNIEAWSLLSEEHYHFYKKQFQEGNYRFNPIITDELGDISGKKILHLQCNIGADTIGLAKMGAEVTGVDIVPKNILFARQLAKDLNIDHVDFIISDIMELMDNHRGKYDIVFTSDGAIGWLPELETWGKTIRFFLKDDGFLYVHDGHPFFMVFDEEKIADGVLEIRYPYFSKIPDRSYEIGGYASDSKEAENYYWNYTVSELINSLAKADLFIEFFNEYDRCVPGMGGTHTDEDVLSYYPSLQGAIPLVFSLKATVR